MKLNGEPGNKLTGVSQLIYDTGAKNIHQRKDRTFSKWWRENWTATYKRMKLDLYLLSYRKINSKWSKDLDIRPETIKTPRRKPRWEAP